MLNKKQIKEIKEHLARAQNPVFYYDNDADGLCSFLLLRRFLGRGHGIAIRSYPGLNGSYASKARDLNADYAFVLDKPMIEKEFVEEIGKLGIPIVWIDHHVHGEKIKGIFSYNSTKRKESGEPVTYACYKMIGRKEDMWIALIGCIADHYMPDFAEEFGEMYREMWGDVKEPFDVYYKTEIGRIARALNFGLKDSISNVLRLQNFLISCKNSNEVLEEAEHNESFRKKYDEIKKKYDVLMEKAKESISGKMIYFEYAGELSISSDLSNELSYLYPEYYIAVIYKKGAISNVSLRGRNVRRILLKVLKKFKESTGGGHLNAVGARLKTEDLSRFKEELEKEVKRNEAT